MADGSMINYPASALEDDDFLLAELDRLATTVHPLSLVCLITKRAALRIREIKRSSAMAKHEEYHGLPHKHPNCEFCRIESEESV